MGAATHRTPVSHSSSSVASPRSRTVAISFIRARFDPIVFGVGFGSPWVATSGGGEISHEDLAHAGGVHRCDLADPLKRLQHVVRSFHDVDVDDLSVASHRERNRFAEFSRELGEDRMCDVTDLDLTFDLLRDETKLQRQVVLKRLRVLLCVAEIHERLTARPTSWSRIGPSAAAMISMICIAFVID